MSIIDLNKVGPAEVAHGFMFLGLFLNVLLLGVLICQIYFYFITYKHDRTWIKLFVVWLFIADNLNTAFVLGYLYQALIVHFDNVSYLQKATWMFATYPATTALIGVSVQMFFSWRIYMLTRNWIWPCVIGLVSLLCAATGIVTSYEVARIGNFTELREAKAIVATSLVSATVADALITIILVCYLTYNQRNNKSGFERSDLIVDRIVRFTLQTGLITFIFVVLDLSFFLADPSGIHLLVSFPISKLYSNSVMCSLNSRRFWKTGNTSHGQWRSGFESETEILRVPDRASIKQEDEVESQRGNRSDIIQLGNIDSTNSLQVEPHHVKDEAGRRSRSGESSW